MGAAFHCHAQDNDDFESFRSGLMDGFQSFRQEVLTGYTDFLRTAWEDFNVFRSESRDSKPKPRTAPTVDSPSPQPRHRNRRQIIRHRQPLRPLPALRLPYTTTLRLISTAHGLCCRH